MHHGRQHCRNDFDKVKQLNSIDANISSRTGIKMREIRVGIIVENMAIM